MIGLGEFFKRIQNIRAKQILVLTEIQSAVKSHTGVEVPLGDISVKNSIVMLKKASQGLRSAVYIKKDAIVDAMTAAQKTYVIKDIR
jgi:hypothetical protein